MTTSTSPSTGVAGVLLPCPFCGGDARITTDYDADGCKHLYVVCAGCRARSGSHFSSDPCPLTHQEVRDDWNRRAAKPATPAKGGEPSGNSGGLPGAAPAGDGELDERDGDGIGMGFRPDCFTEVATPAGGGGELPGYVKTALAACEPHHAQTIRDFIESRRLASTQAAGGGGATPPLDGSLPLIATGPYVDRIIRLFREHPADDATVQVLTDFGNASIRAFLEKA